MSSWSGLKKADGQRLGPLLGALCATTTPTLRWASNHPRPVVRTALDKTFALVGGRQRHGVSERDLTVDGTSGARLPARLYTPDGAGPDSGLLVFLHGGGFVLGGLDSHASTCRFTAREAGCKVLAVGYRKAPEVRFPGALDDCTAAFRWAVAHAGELGVDPGRIGVGGDSAGGNLSIGVALATAQDERGPCGAWLIYPLVDADIAGWPSGQAFFRGPLLSTPCAQDMLRQYAPNPRAQLDPRLSTIDAEDLAGLPPTYIATAGMDPLRDQGEAFGERLRAAGVDVEVRRFDDLPHGFDLLLVDAAARRATAETCRALQRLLAPSRATATARPAAGVSG